jgi:transcriptional regulator with XRE-family HTH domain
MATTSALLKAAIQSRGISNRKAAEEIGVAHTTLQRVLEGDPFDMATAEKISAWLDIPLSTLLDTRGDSPDALAATISAVLREEPRLAGIFGEAMERVLSGQMSMEGYRQLLAYTAFALNMEDEKGTSKDAEGNRPEKRRSVPQGGRNNIEPAASEP